VNLQTVVKFRSKSETVHSLLNYGQQKHLHCFSIQKVMLMERNLINVSLKTRL
jgi:hypothetical protein